MKYFLTTLCLVGYLSLIQAQELPFKSIPDAPENYTAANLTARMVQGLGFRYYWATEGLMENDLKFAPAEGGRSSRQTVNHLYALSRFLLSALEKEVFNAGDAASMSFKDLRSVALKNIETAANILKGSSEEDFKDYNMGFANG